MPRTSRLLIPDEKAVYRVMSCSALDGFPLKDVEKDFMLDLINRFSALYFTEILGFCLMGNHFHLLVKMIPESDFADDDIRKRFEAFYGDSREFAEGQIPYWREMLCSLSEFGLKELYPQISPQKNRLRISQGRQITQIKKNRGIASSFSLYLNNEDAIPLFFYKSEN